MTRVEELLAVTAGVARLAENHVLLLQRCEQLEAANAVLAREVEELRRAPAPPAPPVEVEEE